MVSKRKIRWQKKRFLGQLVQTSDVFVVRKIDINTQGADKVQRTDEDVESHNANH